MKYGTAFLKDSAVFKPQIDMNAVPPSPSTFGEHMQTLAVIRGQEQLPAMTFQPGSRQMRLVLEKKQSPKFRLVLSPNVEPNSTPILE